jgi:hypothetical protein
LGKKSVTIEGDTSGTWLTTNGKGISLVFALSTGSSFLATADSWNASTSYGVTGQTQILATSSATWQVTGVQLEVGTSATPFEFLPYDVNLKRCRRYYFKPEFGTEHYLNTIDSDNTFRRTNIVHPNSMRASPTGTVTTSLGGGGTHSAGKPTVSGTNKDSSAINGDLTGNAGYARIVTLTLDAEL